MSHLSHSFMTQQLLHIHIHNNQVCRLPHHQGTKTNSLMSHIPWLLGYIISTSGNTGLTLGRKLLETVNQIKPNALNSLSWRNIISYFLHIFFYFYRVKHKTEIRNALVCLCKLQTTYFILKCIKLKLFKCLAYLF